jgi:hypothetical protein
MGTREAARVRMRAADGGLEGTGGGRWRILFFGLAAKFLGVRIDAAFGEGAGDVVEGGGDEFWCIKNKENGRW